MDGFRSPFALRSRKSAQLSNIIKSDNKENSKITKSKKTTPPTIKPKSTTSKVPSASEQLSEFKEIIANQQKKFNEAIQTIRQDINQKCTNFGSVFASLKAEIEEIKTAQIEFISKHVNSNALQPIWRKKNAQESIDFLLYGMCIERVEKEYQIQMNNIDRRVGALEIINKYCPREIIEIDEDVCECEYNLFDVYVCKIHPNKNISQFDNNPTDKNNMNNIDFAIASLQEQIDNLSSKYAVFDAELNDHLTELNQHIFESNDVTNNNNNPKCTTNEQKKMFNKNCFTFQNSANNRFIGKHNKYAYSESLDVRVEYATVYDLNLFKLEFKKQFERRTGKGSIRSIAIQHYKINNGVIHQIDAVILFRTSLSYCYLNDIEFPTNWTFFDRMKYAQSKHPARQRKKLAAHNKRG